jgi:hypothetical protein
VERRALGAESAGCPNHHAIQILLGRFSCNDAAQMGVQVASYSQSTLMRPIDVEEE